MDERKLLQLLMADLNDLWTYTGKTLPESFTGMLETLGYELSDEKESLNTCWFGVDLERKID